MKYVAVRGFNYPKKKGKKGAEVRVEIGDTVAEKVCEEYPSILERGLVVDADAPAEPTDAATEEKGDDSWLLHDAVAVEEGGGDDG